jgi:hypothetical protein
MMRGGRRAAISRKYASGVRSLVLAAAIALASAAPAAASMFPPPSHPLFGSPVALPTRVHADGAQHGCMAREQRVKVARWLAPVACEQPPRSEVLLAPLYGGF